MSDKAMDTLNYAWTIICNVDWTKQTQEWQDAAAKLREEYHELLGVARKVEDPSLSREEILLNDWVMDPELEAHLEAHGITFSEWKPKTS